MGFNSGFKGLIQRQLKIKMVLCVITQQTITNSMTEFKMSDIVENTKLNAFHNTAGERPS
jgi:hypothetical protein